MTVLEAIQQAHIEAGMTIKSFMFANLSEFKLFWDSFNVNDVPVNILVPFESNGRYVRGQRKASIPLQGWILTRVKNDRFDYRSAKVEEDYIKPMRDKAITFLSGVVNSEVTDPEVDEPSDNIKPEYAFTAHRLFGVSYRMTWPVVENLCELE